MIWGVFFLAMSPESADSSRRLAAHLHLPGVFEDSFSSHWLPCRTRSRENSRLL